MCFKHKIRTAMVSDTLTTRGISESMQLEMSILMYDLLTQIDGEKGTLSLWYSYSRTSLGNGEYMTDFKKSPFCHHHRNP